MQKKMLIYIFAEHYPTPYKPYFDTQFSYLIRQGHVIRVFAFGKYTGTLNKEVKLYELDRKTRYLPTTLKTLMRFVVPISISFLRQPFKNIKRSLVAYDKSQSFKQTLMAIARIFLLPCKSPDLCLIHNLGAAANFLFLSAVYPGSRVVMFFHGGEIPRTPRITNDKLIFDKMDIVFTNTEFSRQQAINRGCDKAKLRISPVGFYIPDYPNGGRKVYRRDGILRLISVGRLGEEKGIYFALEALRDLIKRGVSNIEYRIIGHGYLFNELREVVRNNGLSNYVVFAGEKSKDDVTKELSLADVLILPSLITETWSETQACVVQEAMLMRLIVVTTGAGGVPESISKEMRRFSVECQNSQAIADKIVEILSLADDEIKEIGKAGRKFVTEGYDVATVTDKILSSL